VGAALRAAEEMLTARSSARLTVENTERIVALVAGADQDDGTGVFKLVESAQERWRAITGVSLDNCSRRPPS
jgi:hypothetical protein